MKLSDPDLRQMLAAEYVLGTLTGGARRRFAREMAADPQLAGIVGEWEARFSGLADEVEPVMPGPWVWQRIEQRLGLTAQPGGSGSADRWGVGFWRGAAGFAAAAAAVFAVALFMQEPVVREVPVEVPVEVRVPQPVEVDRMAAVLTGEEARSAWMVSGPETGERLTVRALSPEPLPADKAYELWLLPEGEDPISLGLLPVSGETTIQPPPELKDMIGPGSALAVSLEPSGGSPTGLPTGPVLYQGESQVL